MKFSSIIAGAFATLATAAPVKEIEKRSSLFGGGLQLGSNFGGGFDANILNGLNFGNDIFSYLGKINGFDQQLIFDLAINNNLALNGLQNPFLLGGQDIFGLNEILQFHSLLLLGWLSSNNIINAVDFGGVQFPGVFDFGILGNQFDQFQNVQFGLDAFQSQQIATVISQVSTIVIKE